MAMSVASKTWPEQREKLKRKIQREEKKKAKLQTKNKVAEEKCKPCEKAN